MIAAAFLALVLFLLSADHLFVGVGGIKVKYAYFAILGLWGFAPRAMLAELRAAVPRVPRLALLPLLPMAIAVATSVNVRSSTAWALWLLFDLFTVATVYAFLKVHAMPATRIRAAAAGSLALIAAFGLIQLVAIQYFGQPLFNPQIHLGIFRLNGLSGWPHFLNIYAFLLLPLVLTARRMSVPIAALLVVLMFVLGQSTAKTGWVLLVALVALLAVVHRTQLLKRFVLLAVPVVLLALLVPLPSYHAGEPALSGAEKLVRFGTNLTETTSVRDRILINTMGLKVWTKHPWFGVGPRAYDTYVFSRFDVELPGENKLDIENKVNAKNENIYIEFLAEAGVLFTLGFVLVIVAALWVPGWRFANSLHLGAWIALVLYFAISGQVSQTGLLTMVYAVFGIYFYARETGADTAADRGVHPANG